jgi:HK97 family phage major capsid protein
VVGTSNTTDFITSAGATSFFTAEGALTTDGTPTLGQVVVTPAKIATWVYGSYEAMDDTALDTQVPALIADAKARLEGTAFTTGSGTGQPWGIITRAASDSTATALTAALIYALHQSLAPRFRAYDSANVAWITNVAILNAMRQIPAFTGAVTSIVNDGAADNIPECLGIDIYEASAMDSTQVTGKHTLAIGDFSQMLLVDRLPQTLLFEPIVSGAGGILPAGQRGWYSYSRVGADITTAGAAFGANAFSMHTN